MSDYAIEVNNLMKEFQVKKKNRPFWKRNNKEKEVFVAVDNINFDVKKGEIFGFLGPNGNCELVQLYSKKIEISLSSVTTTDSSRLNHKSCLSSLSNE